MYDGNGIYPRLHGRDIRCASFVGWGFAFQKVVPDFGRLLIASGNHMMSKRRLATDEAHRVWMALCDGRVERFHTRSVCRSQVKSLPPCVQRNGICAQRIWEIFTTYPYFHLISGVGNDLSFMLKAPQARLTAVKRASPTPGCNLKAIE